MKSPDELDLNACGGTHVASTSQIGGLLLRGQRAYASQSASPLFAAIAPRRARADEAMLAQLAAALSWPRRHSAALERLRAKAKAAAKSATLREELADYHASRLLVEDPPQQIALIRRIFPDRDADYVKLLASRLISAAPHTVALLASTRTTASPATVASPAARSWDGMPATCCAPRSQPSGGRGGGSATLAQGLVPGPSRRRARCSGGPAARQTRPQPARRVSRQRPPAAIVCEALPPFSVGL